MTIQEANVEICIKLLNWFNDPKNKDIRFFQGLQDLKLQRTIDADPSGWRVIEDNWVEESEKTLNKLKNILNELY